ncbi:unnamed protein product [Eruca vesicaria subsp. sativa]|uniref:SS18 N-terminal domain-containing protein n=1 Tax=Eruca vesicaria subsp. sativa TaxID=29727 RepID=A0ABC8M2W0_ERUVS|nr:unnamed protein product [Eruca vesicaria subsp. sativa]
MQQHLMQMQPMMAGYYPSNVTSDHIQQYLDENKSLILKIVESQNSGKLSECAENQARLQRNLMYLAAIADSQPQPPSVHSQQYGSGGGGLIQGEGGGGGSSGLQMFQGEAGGFHEFGRGKLETGSGEGRGGSSGDGGETLNYLKSSDDGN